MRALQKYLQSFDTDVLRSTLNLPISNVMLSKFNVTAEVWNRALKLVLASK